MYKLQTDTTWISHRRGRGSRDSIIVYDDPMSYLDDIQSDDSDMWHEAIKSEIDIHARQQGMDLGRRAQEKRSH